MTQLHFKGKEFVYNHHLAVPFHPLMPQPDKGIGAVRLDGNLIVQGDNLLALKSLLPMYAGKIDCVFIDPPYNTGNEGWCYNDNVNAPMIREWLNSNPVGVEDGLRHDKWCAMMWPRLRLLRELLHEDGVIFVSIDDVSVHHLRMMMDDIFGEQNFIAHLIWKSRQNKDNRNVNGVSNDHEYVIAYGSKLRGEERDASQYSNPDNDARGAWVSGNMVGIATKDARPNLHYDLINPATSINYGCPAMGWRFEKIRMLKMMEEGRILWPVDEGGRPRAKVFLKELKQAFTGFSSIIGADIYTRDGTKGIDEIFGERKFDFPKPYELIYQLIEQATREDAIILDSFAGSGTTAHAVLAANKRDGGHRRFILVEMEDYADALTAERVRRVINGYAFQGKQKTELLREKLNWRSLQQAETLVHQVQGIENLHGHEYDRIKKEVKGGELIVTGEKTVAGRAEGLGGEFTYCTLGAAVELEKILSGAALPPYAGLAAALFHMASNQAFDPAGMREADFYLGNTDTHHVWLIYRADLDWLKSPEAALTLTRARTFAATDPQKRHLVFAPARFVSQKMLAEENIPVEFVPLPFALYRINRS